MSAQLMPRELIPGEGAINEKKDLVVAEYGDGLPWQPDHYEHEIRRELRRGVEAFLRAGKLLLVARTCATHGEWEGMLDRLGLERSQASRMIEAAKRVANVATSQPLLAATKSQGKLIELLSLPEEQFRELAETGETGGLTTDDVSRMTVRELREAVREAREDIVAKDQRAAERERALDAQRRLVSKARREWEAATPDQRVDMLRQRLSSCVLAIRSLIVAAPMADGEPVQSLRTTSQALIEMGTEVALPQLVAAAAAFDEIERDVRALRDELGIPASAGAAAADPEWMQ